MIRSLRFKTALVNVVFVAVLLAGMVTAIIVFTGNYMNSSLYEHLREAADATESHALLTGKESYLVITDTDAFGSEELAKDEAMLLEAREILASGELPQGRFYSNQAAFVMGEADGERFLIVGSASYIGRFLKLLIHRCITVALVILAFFTVCALLLSRWITRPVETAWTYQKQFISDASHELKTPLTVLITNAEMLEHEELDEETRIRMTDHILVTAQRMKALTNSLLEMARLDAAEARQHFEDLNLSEIVEDVSMAMEVVLFEKGLTLRQSVQPNIRIRGSRRQLEELLEVFLDNASKYTQGDWVGISLKRIGFFTCQLTVEDPGDPISDAERENIFHRFYRRDVHYSETAGSGLGLAIALNIVNRHGGRIVVESENGMNRFKVELKTI